MTYIDPLSGAAKKLWLQLPACLLLAACATEPPVYQAAIRAPQPLPVTTRAVQESAALPEPFAPAPPETAQADAITPLDYYEWAMAATPPELMAERLRLTSRRTPADPVIDSVHLGILMSLSALASPDNEQAAIDLLEAVDDPASASDAGREYAIFAQFLLDHLRQREDLRAATSNFVVSREELETLTRNNRQLQEKIEALTRLEEQLIEREQSEVQGDIDPEGAQR